MKIALVSPYDYAYPGGVSVHIYHLARQFSRMGHRVKILAPCSNIKAVSDRQDFIALGRPFPVPSGGSVARISLSWWLLPRVRAILRGEGFDVVHVHEPSTALLPWAAIYFSKSVKVATFHAYHGKPRAYHFWKWFLEELFNRLDGRIAVSQPAREFIAECFPADYRIIPNGVDLEQFSAQVSPLEEFSDGKLNILFVGRLETRKGFGYLLGAYGRVKEEFPHCRLIVVGSGTRLRKGYEELVMEKEIKDVVFCGYVPDTELPRYYHTADLFCAPAIGLESFGMVLLEAMAAGKPIVASNIKGYADLVAQGSEGLLVPPRNEEALAQAIVSLLKDESLRQQMGQRGRVKVEEYSWERVAERVMDYYLELLGGRASGG